MDCWYSKKKARTYALCQLFNFIKIPTGQCNPSWWVVEGNLQWTKCLFHVVSWICNRNPAVLAYPVTQLWSSSGINNFVLFIEQCFNESCRLNVTTEVEVWRFVFLRRCYGGLWRKSLLEKMLMWLRFSWCFSVAPDKFCPDLHPRGLEPSSAMLWDPQIIHETRRIWGTEQYDKLWTFPMARLWRCFLL